MLYVTKTSFYISRCVLALNDGSNLALSVFRATLEECLMWKESFEKLLSSKCKYISTLNITREYECAHTAASHTEESSPSGDHYVHWLIQFNKNSLCPQMDCVPSRPSWCRSLAKRTSCSTLPVKITEEPSQQSNYRPKPKRSMMNSSAAMLHER